jgi:hypothetical protein
MRKLILILLVIGSLCLFSTVFAADKYGLDTAAGQLKTQKIAGGSDVPTIIGGVVGVGLSLLGVAFFLLLLYAGFLWMTAMGDKGKIDRAKDILEAAVVGLLIVIAAYAIATFVFSNLAGGGAGTSTTPTAGQDCATAGGVCRLDMEDCNSNLGTSISGQCPAGYPICCTK